MLKSPWKVIRNSTYLNSGQLYYVAANVYTSRTLLDECSSGEMVLRSAEKVPGLQLFFLSNKYILVLT